MSWQSLIPSEVVELCQVLQTAGYAAFVVGGAVRDLLRSPHRAAAKDFDVATSAAPDEVVRIFGNKRTIPTGLQHGTVTVLTRPGGGPGGAVEITTFRGEGEYLDGRRPKEVRFIGDLVEDLRRRDFTINAMAYDPVGQTLHDPFGGQDDLRAGVIRAVGDASQRFSEDGLRLLRAVRFAAQLGFDIDPATRAAFSPTLPTLTKVSRERVRDELLRLLAASVPSRGLLHLFDWDESQGLVPGGLASVALPQVEAVLLQQPRGAARRWLLAIDALSSPIERLLAVLWPLRGAPPKSERTWLTELDVELKLPTSDRLRLARALLLPDVQYEVTTPWLPVAVRRWMAQHDEQAIADFLRVEQALAQQSDDSSRHQGLLALGQAVAEVQAQGAVLRVAQLAVSGQDLMAALSLPAGRWIGACLRELLSDVIADPHCNRRDWLIVRAQAIVPALIAEK